jgi:hypothetical protein
MKQKINPQKRKASASRANKGEAFRDLTKGRICSICNKYKERECFFEHPSGFNGLGPRCKECISLAGKTPKAKMVKKALYDKRKDSNVCVKCGESELVNNVHCRLCWFIDKASMRGGGSKNLNAICDLWNQQQGRCFYTNEVLVPGKNASLDHQLPRSRGGADDPANLKWVSNKINMMKSDMTHDEFIVMCKYITTKF